MSDKVKSFEDLRIFQQARDLVKEVYALTRLAPLSKDYSLADQMRRAAVSILSNIAEGFERQSNAEFARFLFVAKGSCGELRAQALVALDQRHWSAATYDGFVGRCRRLSAGLANLISYLKKSGVRNRKVE